MIVSNKLLFIELKWFWFFFRLSYLLFFGLIKKPLLYLKDKNLIARGEKTLQQKRSVMLFSLLISSDKDQEVREPIRPFRLLITLHKITFSSGCLFQLQLCSPAGFNHCSNRLEQSRKGRSPPVRSFPFPILLYVFIRSKERFLNAESPIYGS